MRACSRIGESALVALELCRSSVQAEPYWRMWRQRDNFQVLVETQPEAPEPFLPAPGFVNPERLAFLSGDPSATLSKAYLHPAEEASFALAGIVVESWYVFFP